MALQKTGSIQGSEIVKACILFGEKQCSGSNLKVCYYHLLMKMKFENRKILFAYRKVKFTPLALLIQINNYLLQFLQKYKTACLGIPSVMSTCVLIQETHMFEALGSISVPHWQHNLYQNKMHKFIRKWVYIYENNAKCTCWRVLACAGLF